MAAVPHFDVPLRYIGGAPVVNEQDSAEDIAACVYAVLATETGSRTEMPDFGLADITFSQQPVSDAVLLAALTQWEPRAVTLVDVAPDLYDASVVNANIEVQNS